MIVDSRDPAKSTEKQRIRMWVIIVPCILITCFVLIMYAYIAQIPWTGFIASQGPNVQQYQPTKTLWDWLQLLIIPIVLSIAAYWLNRVNSASEQRAAEQKEKTDRAIAEDSQQSAVFQDYLDRMSDLLLNQKKGDQNPDATQPNNTIYYIIRARTLTTLSSLNHERKRLLIQFLYETQLLAPNEHQNNQALLRHADLRKANLRNINLSGADLQGADLSHADLSLANLSEAKLRHATLKDTVLNGAILRDADLYASNLNNAILRDAELQNTNLTKSDLTNAEITLSDVSHANFRDATVNGLTYDKNTNFDRAIISEHQWHAMRPI